MSRLLLIRFIAGLFALSAVCLQAQQYVFRAYRQAEGLKNLAVNALTRDRNGFLWVATENGVYRFLGSSFEQYGREKGIADLDARNIVADPNGTVWVGTLDNLYRWDGQRFLPAREKPIHVRGLHSIAVENASHLLAVEDSSHLLVVDEHRLYRLEHDASGRMLSYGPVFDDRLIAANPDLGNVSSVSLVDESPHGSRAWIGCGKKLCSWLDGGTAAPGQPRDSAVTEWGQDKGLLQDDWQTVLMDRAGTLWAAGQKHIAVLPRGSARFIDRTIPGSDLESVYSHAPMIEDREGRILAPSEDGIARWDGAGWQIIGRPNGLLHASHIVGFAFDAAGDLWLGCRGDGLYNWAGYEDWIGWGAEQGLPSASVWSILPSSQGRVFVGTDKGPAWIDPRTGSSGPLLQGYKWAFGQVGAMGTNRDGSLWAATFSGAFLRIDPRTGRTEQTARLPALITYALQDSAGREFFATNQGVYVRAAGATKSAPQHIAAVDALLGSSVQTEAACEAPDGAIWLMANDRLLRGLNGQWTAPRIEGLPPLRGSLLAISCAQDGALWIAGDQDGIWRLTPGGDHMRAWQLQLPPAFSSIAPLAILTDRRGWVWLGTDSGLLVWNGQNWRHLTQETGLIWNDVNQGALCSGPDGSLWIGTSGGVAHLLHPERVFDSVPLAISITEIRHGNEVYTGAQQVTLPWPGTPLRFQVASPTTRNRSELVLRILMEGRQKDWVDTQSGIATFSNLPSGVYTFTAMACNPGLQACSDTVRAQIRILPPWWMTWWSYTLSGLAFLALLAGAGWLSVKHLRQRARDLERLVQERTQELEFSREQLRIQATHDGLTGLLNRAAVLDALEAEMDRARREKRTFVVALVDLDHFKRVNDTHGHLAGDEGLRRFASAVKKAIRAYDHAGRYGGEEFLLIVNQVPQEAADQRLKSLHASISNLQVSTQESQFQITCSIGATVFNPSDEHESVESLLAVADLALYAAKASGRNCVVFRDAGSAA